ncbi:hypothetical protein [Myceligenerans crystallogenes]|uniref:Uncharacterized protein n=1 Tax=Myceligenerans crystallogenes TaxID=316335 RepID=A0ABP4ZXV4_9MICO
MTDNALHHDVPHDVAPRTHGDADEHPPAARRRDRAGRPSPARATLRFLLHLAEMIVAMVAGMVLLAPLWDLGAAAVGAERVLARPDVGALVMLADMLVAMTVWMRVRRHAWRAIAEMDAAMAAPYLVLLPLLWAGVLDGPGLMVWSHVVMVPAMAAAMWWRRAEYTGHPAGHAGAHGLDLRWLARRWPVLPALALMTLTLLGGGDVPAWILAPVAAVYPVMGALRRSIRGLPMWRLQLAGLVVFAGIALVAVALGATTAAAFVLAAGLLGHAVWDAFHHRAGAVVYRWYAESCVVYDILLALAVVAAAVA